MSKRGVKSAAFVALLVLLSSLFGSVISQDKAIICYLESWATYRPGDGRFEPENIDPFVCTHLIYAFAGIDDTTNEIQILDPYYESCYDWNLCAYGRFTNLKLYNPNLKTLLSVGGWNEGSDVFSSMAATPESRATFIDSSIDLLIRYNFDGLDIDWAGIGYSNTQYDDKENFVMLLSEMREAFDNAQANGDTGDLGRLMMTVAAPAEQEAIDQASYNNKLSFYANQVYNAFSMFKGYDITEISKYVDFINVMTYSYQWHHAPLYALPLEEDPSKEHYGFNANYSINYWIDGGAPRNQINLGIPAFGVGFVLADANDNGFYAPATGPSPGGPYTNDVGLLSFHEYCEIVDSYSIVRDSYVVSPYGYDNQDWIGYDDWESAEVKARYIQAMGLAGAVVWSIDYEDYMGKCGAGKNPIITSLAEVLNGGPMTTPPGYTVPTTSTVTPTTEKLPPPNAMCNDTGTIHVDPNGDCSKYYSCYVGSDGEWVTYWGECPEDLVFIESIQACDYPGNHPDDPCVNSHLTTSASTSDDSDQQCSPDPEKVCLLNPTMLYDNTCDCTHYFECSQGSGGDGGWELVEKLCAPGTVFNPEVHYCDFPENVQGCEDEG